MMVIQRGNTLKYKWQPNYSGKQSNVLKCFKTNVLKGNPRLFKSFEFGNERRLSDKKTCHTWI